MLQTGFQVALHVWVDREAVGAVWASGARRDDHEGRSIVSEKRHNVRIQKIVKEKYPGVKLDGRGSNTDSRRGQATSLWAPFLIQGGLQGAFGACRDIRQRAEEIDDVVVELALKEAARGAFLAGGLSRIKRISAETRSRIYVPTTKEELTSAVLVEGDLDGAEKACQALLRMAGVVVAGSGSKAKGSNANSWRGNGVSASTDGDGGGGGGRRRARGGKRRGGNGDSGSGGSGGRTDTNNSKKGKGGGGDGGRSSRGNRRRGGKRRGGRKKGLEGIKKSIGGKIVG